MNAIPVYATYQPIKGKHVQFFGNFDGLRLLEVAS